MTRSVYAKEGLSVPLDVPVPFETQLVEEGVYFTYTDWMDECLSPEITNNPLRWHKIPTYPIGSPFLLSPPSPTPSLNSIVSPSLPLVPPPILMPAKVQVGGECNPSGLHRKLGDSGLGSVRLNPISLYV